MGRILFQANPISLSYRYRGKVARSHIQTSTKKSIPAALKKFEADQKIKKRLVRNLKNKIIEYSAIKMKVKPIAPNSTLNPETNSDSPSEKSKGLRFVSATQDISQRAATLGHNIKSHWSLFINLTPPALFPRLL